MKFYGTILIAVATWQLLLTDALVDSFSAKPIVRVSSSPSFRKSTTQLGNDLKPLEPEGAVPEPPHSKLASLAAKVVPPIPEREVPSQPSLTSQFRIENIKKSLQVQFEPKFIVEEFLYGFRYMVRVLPLLLCASGLCHFLRYKFLLESKRQIAFLSSGAPFALLRWEHRMKRIVQGILGVSKLGKWPRLIVSNVLIGPPLEEIAYRGFGHALGWWNFVTSGVVVALMCRVSATVWAGFYLLGLCCGFFDNAKLLLSPEIPVVSSPEIMKLLESLVIAPLTWQLIRLKWRDGKDRSTDDTDLVTAKSNNKFEVFAGLLAGITTRKFSRQANSRSVPPRSLVRSVAASLPVSARLCGAICFANAHFVGDFSCPPAFGMDVIQKRIGTFASSMLVESRLVCKRRNLWGAIGAHMAFNLLFPTMALTAVRLVGGNLII